jgi:DNA-binding transcriptional LysR family regulator
LFRAYNQGHSRVRIEFIDGNPAEHVSAVRQLLLDVAFITGKAQWSGCESDHLWSERVFAVLPCHHGLSNKQELEWRELASERFIVSDAGPGPEIHDYLVQRLADLGHHPEIQVHGVGRDNLLSLVSIGRGLTVMSEAGTAAQFPGIAYRPITEESLPFCAVWSRRNDNPSCRRLPSLARSMARMANEANC